MKMLKRLRKDKKTSTNHNQSESNFIQAADYFINLDNQRIRNLNKIFLILIFVLLVITFCAVLAVLYLTPLKTIEPMIVQVDKITGDTTVVTTLPKVVKSYDTVIDEHFLTNYVQYRESYDWFYLNDYYNATILMSSDDVAANYKKLYGSNNTSSPMNILRNDFKVIVRINSIQYVGDTAQVRFTKIKKPVVDVEELAAEQFQEIPLLAIIAFKYDRTREMTNKERRLNPLGFTVSSYQVTNDSK